MPISGHDKIDLRSICRKRKLKSNISVSGQRRLSSDCADVHAVHLRSLMIVFAVRLQKYFMF